MGVTLVPTLLINKVFAEVGPLALPQMNAVTQIRQIPRSPMLVAQQSNFTSFFEEGRLPSENQLRRPTPDPTIPIAQNSQTWQPIFFRAGGFSFWMPPGTLSEERIVLQTQVGAASFRTLAANSDRDRYVVGYADQLTPAQLKNPQLLLSALTNKVVVSQKFKLIRNQPTMQGSVQGRELLYQNDTEVIAFRVFLRQNTAYLIGSRALKSEGIPSRKTTIFLNSFEFLS